MHLSWPIIQTHSFSIFHQPCIGRVLPAMAHMYPNALVEANVLATEVPNIEIAPKGINVRLHGLIEFYVTQNVTNATTSTPHFTFATNVDITLNVSVTLRDLKIVAEFTDYNIDLSLNRTDIGDVNIGYLQFVVNIFMMTSIMPRLDLMGEAGFQLPVIKDVEYLNPSIVFLENAIYAGVDAHFTGI